MTQAAMLLFLSVMAHGCIGPMDRLIQTIDAAALAAHSRAQMRAMVPEGQPPVDEFTACVAGTAAAIGMANVRVSVMWGNPTVAARSYCFRAE